MSDQNHPILARLPHRYPMILVDRVLEVVPGSQATALKCVSFGESCFQGHFPEQPVFPGVLLIEALAQTTALAITPLRERAVGVLAGIKQFRFLRTVHPGDTLELRAVLVDRLDDVLSARVEARRDGEIVARGEIRVTSEGAA